MASRWLAIISACQTSPIAMMLIATTQTAMTRVFCVSETGIRIERAIQDIVRGLLVLGRYAVSPTRDLPADATRVAPRMLATQGPVRYASKSVHRLRKFAASSAWTRLSEFGFGTCLMKKGAVAGYIFSAGTQDFPLTVSTILSHVSAEPRSISRNRAGGRSLLGAVLEPVFA